MKQAYYPSSDDDEDDSSSSCSSSSDAFRRQIQKSQMNIMMEKFAFFACMSLCDNDFPALTSLAAIDEQEQGESDEEKTVDETSVETCCSRRRPRAKNRRYNHDESSLLPSFVDSETKQTIVAFPPGTIVRLVPGLRAKILQFHSAKRGVPAHYTLQAVIVGNNGENPTLGAPWKEPCQNVHEFCIFGPTTNF